MIAGGPAIGRRGGLPDVNESAETPGQQDADDPRVQLVSAVLYVIGITLGAVGWLGAFLWAPLLWCAAAGLVVIAVSFTIIGGRR